MGLSERKVKQRIGLDPRNLTWSNDNSRFSYKHMTNLGWNDSQGLGASASGNPNHIAVVRKSDNGGIGMLRAKREGDDMAAGAGQAGRGLEDVLKRLASASASASPSPAPESPKPEDGEVKKRNKIASRQRHLQSKRLAHSSPAALAEILGVPIESLTASPSPAPSAPASPSPAPLELSETSPSLGPERTAEEPVKTSNLSVTDYFRQKMREKMLQRQAAAAANGGPVPEMPAGSYSIVKEEVKVDVGGVGWEGTKVKFEEEDVKVKLEDLGGEAGPSELPVVMDDRAAKKARKEAKRLKKLAEAEVKIEETSATVEVLDVKPTLAALQAEDLKASEKKIKQKRKEENRKRKLEREESETKEDKKKRKRDEQGDEGKDRKEKKEKRDKSDKETRQASS